MWTVAAYRRTHSQPTSSSYGLNVALFTLVLQCEHPFTSTLFFTMDVMKFAFTFDNIRTSNIYQHI